METTSENSEDDTTENSRTETIASNEAAGDDTARNETAVDERMSRPPRVKKAKKVVQSTEDMMTSAFSILKGAAQRKENVAQSNIDECDSFGLFITNKLKSYTRLTRSKVQHLISNILFSADQGEYEVNCATQPVPQIFRPYTFEYQTPGEQSLGQSVPAQNYYSQSARYVPPSTPSPQTSTHSVRSEGSSCNEYQHQASQVHPTYQGAQYQYQSHSSTAPEKPHQPISPISRPVPPSEPSSNQAQESQDILDEFSDLIS